MTIYTVRTTSGREGIVIDMLESKLKAEGLDIKTIFHPAEIKGYIFLEGSLGAIQKLIKGVMHIRGLIEKPVSLSEIQRFLEYKKERIQVNIGDVVEIIGGPFKAEKGKITRVDKVKNEVTVELLEATIPIPVTITTEFVKVLKAAKKPEAEAPPAPEEAPQEEKPGVLEGAMEEAREKPEAEAPAPPEAEKVPAEPEKPPQAEEKPPEEEAGLAEKSVEEIMEEAKRKAEEILGETAPEEARKLEKTAAEEKPPEEKREEELKELAEAAKATAKEISGEKREVPKEKPKTPEEQEISELKKAAKASEKRLEAVKESMEEAEAPPAKKPEPEEEGGASMLEELETGEKKKKKPLEEEF